ncbi:hypothetical protein [Flavobacterium sp. N2038]|uniref:hypothetical protein n=1 Tax=Flavobacterium sp. N2038 TaxID=2986829 RepID=UPI0022248FAC|nr:hypothetical protein [Flavobacterium sp. N2038]
MLDQEIFIKKFENQEFSFCGVNWWPLIKIQVAYQIHLKNSNIFALHHSDKYYHEIQIQRTLKDKLRFYLQFLKTTKPAKNLIVTDYSHKYNTSNGTNTGSNPYTDPFIHYFEKLKIDFTIFDYKKERFLLNFDLKSLKKIYLEQIKYSFRNDAIIQSQLKQFCSFLELHYGNDFKLYNHLIQSIIDNQVEYLIYSFVLKKGNVKNILLYCYYNNTMMSIIRAANHLDIQTIEYQHSQVTSNHFAYSSWSIKNNNSKGFFPAKMWVWRQSDAEYLAKHFQCVKKIGYVIGGNLSLKSAKTIKIEKSDLNIKVLVTLQGIGLPDYVINCLSKYPNLILYLRLHPRYSQDKEMCEVLKAKYNDQIEIDLSNSLTLHELLSFADYHLTNFSGSAIEAEHFDVTNIIYGDKGYISYENEITTGKYLFINNQNDLDNIFAQKLKHKPNSIVNKKDIFELIKENFN